MNGVGMPSGWALYCISNRYDKQYTRERAGKKKEQTTELSEKRGVREWWLCDGAGWRAVPNDSPLAYR